MSSQQRRGRRRNSIVGTYNGSSSAPIHKHPDRSIDNLLPSFGSLTLESRSDHWPSLRSPNTAARGRTTRIQQSVSDNELEGHVRSVLESMTPSAFEVSLKREICGDLERIVRTILPYSDLRIMGGLGNTFALKDSDVDLCITNTQELDHWKLHQLKREFEKAVGHQIELLLHTYIPLFRLSVTRARWPKQVQVEISWKNDIGIYKTELLAAYSRVDSRVKSLVVFIKYWSKRRGLTNTTPGQGGMGSFAWSLLCIYFLMKATTPQVVPNLQALATTRRNFQEYDISFEKEAERLWTSRNVKVPALVLQSCLLNEQTVGTLVKEFFEFANSFDFDRRVVSIRKPEHCLTKSDKGWTAGLVRGTGRGGQRVRHSYYIAIEDPFVTTDNAARTLSDHMYVKIKAEFNRARSIFSGTWPGAVNVSSICAEGS